MLISTNIASTKLIKHTKDIDKAEDKALAHTEKTVQETYTTEEDTKEAKEIENSNKRSVISVTNQAAS
jgi:hypothetical protein